MVDEDGSGTLNLEGHKVTKKAAQEAYRNLTAPGAGAEEALLEVTRFAFRCACPNPNWSSRRGECVHVSLANRANPSCSKGLTNVPMLLMNGEMYTEEDTYGQGMESVLQPAIGKEMQSLSQLIASRTITADMDVEASATPPRALAQDQMPHGTSEWPYRPHEQVACVSY